LEKELKNTGKKTRSLPRRIFRALLFLFMGLFSFLLTLAVLLALPPVQTFIAQKAAGYFSEKLGISVSIDRVAINPFSGNVEFKGIMVLDHHADTLLMAEKLGTSIGSLDISSTHFVLGETTLSNALFRLHKYKGEQGMNLDYIIRKLKSDKKKEGPAKPFLFEIQKINLSEVSFNMINEDSDTMPAKFQAGNIRTRIGTGEMHDFKVAADSISMNVRELRAMDISGSGMAHFETDFLICSSAMIFENTLLETVDGSFVKGDIRFFYSNWRSMGSFIDSVRFDTDIEQSSIRLKDIAYYTDALAGVPVTARFKGKVKGPISALKGRDLRVSYGENTQLEMDADVYGLPDINNTIFDLKIRKLATIGADLAKVKVNDAGDGITVPKEIYNMGLISYTGRLTGNLLDFVSKGTLNTAVGSVYTDLRLASEPGFKNPEYSGFVKTSSFNPGKIMGNTRLLGPISGELTISGKGFNPKTMTAKADGTLSAFSLLGYNYHNVTVNGTFEKMAFTGNLDVNDENLFLDFEGNTDFSTKNPVFNFEAELKRANLQKLGFWNDTLIFHRAKIAMEMKAGSLDNLMGSIRLDSISFSADTKTHYVENISIQADSVVNDRRIKIGGSLLDAEITGDYTIIPLANNLMYNLNDYFPSFKLKYDSVLARKAQRLYFDITVHNLQPVFDVFSPKVFVSPQTTLNGKYFSEVRSAELMMESGFIGYDKIRINDPELLLSTSESNVELDLNVSRFFASDSLWFDYITLVSQANNDSVKVGLNWRDDVYNISKGTINFQTWLGNPGTYDLYFFDSGIFLKDTEWRLKQNAFVGYSSTRLTVNDFELNSENGSFISVNGVGDKGNTNKLNIGINNLPLAYFKSFGSKIPDMGGSLSGKADLYALFDKPFVSADFRVDTFSVFGQSLGDLEFKSDYNNIDQSLTINGGIETLDGNSLEFKNGKIYLVAKDQNFNIDIAFNRFNIKPAEAFIAPILTNIRGFLTGNMQLKGTFSQPIITGNAHIDDGHVDVPFIGGSYNLKFLPGKKARISRSMIDFGSIQLEDDNFKTATLKGNIKHKDFKGFELYMEVFGKDFKFFNPSREQSSAFYGTAIGTGTVLIKGPFEMLDVYASIKSEKGTRLFIPMTDGPSQAAENSFVVFVDGRDSTGANAKEKERPAPTGIQLHVDAEINENAEVQIIFDEFSGDVLKSYGNGNLRIELNRLGDLTMFGDYEVIKGDYLFTLKNLVNKKLKLVRGGTIYWSGDPTKAKIDASASYSVRTSAAPLMAATAPDGNPDNLEDSYKARIPVDVVVKLSGELLEPQISFDIQFPTVDERTRTQLLQALSSEDEKNKQAFALLVLRQFISSGTGANDAVNVAGGNTLEVLSNQLSNWVSQISNGLDLGVRYRNRENTSSGQDEVELALSTKLFNDRVAIDGNFGLAASKSTNPNVAYNNMLDVSVEVKITEDGKLRIRGFNRSNDANIIQAFPYTQGVGISYQTSFDTWDELVKRRKAKKSTKKNNRIPDKEPATLPPDSMRVPYIPTPADTNAAP